MRLSAYATSRSAVASADVCQRVTHRVRARAPGHFKAPRGVTFVGELPKTATGKIQEFVLRKGAPNLSRQ
jgi:acyl-coenzyme A synthetase/AMP-(fatty) acid ligase